MNILDEISKMVESMTTTADLWTMIDQVNNLYTHVHHGLSVLISHDDGLLHQLLYSYSYHLYC